MVLPLLSFVSKTNAVVKTRKLLSSKVDFRSARLVSKEGRGFVNVEARDKEVVVSFADDFDGAVPYELEIAFGE